MLAASPLLHTEHPILGSIRTAERRDAAGVSRLLAAANQNATIDEHAHLLVLDVDGAVCAVERIVMDRARATIQLLVVDPALKTATIEIADRMLGVALALCEAYGCAEIEVIGMRGSS